MCQRHAALANHHSACRLAVIGGQGLLHTLVEGAELLVGLGQRIPLQSLLLTNDPTVEFLLFILVKQAVGLSEHLLQTRQIVGKGSKKLAELGRG